MLWDPHKGKMLLALGLWSAQIPRLNDVLYTPMAGGEASSFNAMCQRRSRGVWTSGKKGTERCESWVVV